MKRSKFSLSHTRLLSCNQGALVPIGLQEVLPGDTFQHSTNLLLRCSPLLAPVMHPINVRVHHWFVPHRLVWDNWEDFITGGPDGLDASVFPTMTFTDSFPAPGGKRNSIIGELADYLGVPTLKSGSTTDFTVSALPFRGYQLIFNEWYRDQDLTTAAAISTADGDDVTTSSQLRYASWEKDYFTTSRPWTQKGPEVTVPFGDEDPLVRRFSSAPAVNLFQSNSQTAATAGDVTTSLSGADARLRDGGNTAMSIDPNGSLYADLSAAGATINELRTAFAIQRYEEARARYGSRYTEYLRYLGVKSSDARLQRPEYLGGGRQVIQFSEVLQTSTPADETPTDAVGAMKGHGIASMRSNRYRRFFEEHGYVFTFVSVLPKTIYSQGLHRTWNRRTKEDFFQKELQHIGQQEVLNKELYVHTSPDGVFGYQDRYSEYRQGFSGVSGEFRDTLDYWHSARIFDTAPTLNNSFISGSTATDRIFAASTLVSDSLYIMARHSIQARRLVSPAGASFVL